METSREERSRTSLFSRLALLVVLLILGVALFGEKGIVRLVKLMRERETLAQEVEQLRRENDLLKKEITALRSDQHYLEQLARRELGMVREDEMVYQFRPAQEPVQPPPSEAGGEY